MIELEYKIFRKDKKKGLLVTQLKQNDYCFAMIGENGELYCWDSKDYRNKN